MHDDVLLLVNHLLHLMWNFIWKRKTPHFSFIPVSCLYNRLQSRCPNNREFTQVCVGILSKSQTKNVNIALVFEDAARLELTAAPLQDQSCIYQVLYKLKLIIIPFCFWAVLKKLINIKVRKLLKMPSRETIPWSHECLPLLGVFCCKKDNTKERLL